MGWCQLDVHEYFWMILNQKHFLKKHHRQWNTDLWRPFLLSSLSSWLEYYLHYYLQESLKSDIVGLSWLEIGVLAEYAEYAEYAEHLKRSTFACYMLKVTTAWKKYALPPLMTSKRWLKTSPDNLWTSWDLSISFFVFCWDFCYHLYLFEIYIEGEAELE